MYSLAGRETERAGGNDALCMEKNTFFAVIISRLEQFLKLLKLENVGYENVRLNTNDGAYIRNCPFA